MALAPTTMRPSPAAEVRYGDALPLSWTTAVAWARAWQPRRLATRDPGAAPLAPAASSDWDAAVQSLAQARAHAASLAERADASDTLPEVVAAHQVFLARRRLRHLQAAAADDEVGVLWH